MDFKTIITTPDTALTHLFFHCCLRDGDFKETELQIISEMIVSAKLNNEINFKEEVISYKSYYRHIEDEAAYLNYLIHVIKPTNKLALFSFCVELLLSDHHLNIGEEVLMKKLAALLGISQAESDTIRKLIMEINHIKRNAVF